MTDSLLSNDPIYKKHSIGREAVKQNIDTLLLKTRSDISLPLETWLAQTEKIMNMMLTELTFLRMMEEHVIQGTMTDEIWDAIHGELSAYRTSLRIESGNLSGTVESQSRAEGVLN